MSISPSEQRTLLLEKLRRLMPLMKGSLALVELTCGTPSCRCHTTGPKHKGYYFSYRLRGKSHTVYIPKRFQNEVKQAHAHWLELKRLLEEWTASEVQELRQKAKPSTKERKES